MVPANTFNNKKIVVLNMLGPQLVFVSPKFGGRIDMCAFLWFLFLNAAQFLKLLLHRPNCFSWNFICWSFPNFIRTNLFILFGSIIFFFFAKCNQILPYCVRHPEPSSWKLIMIPILCQRPPQVEQI